MHVRRRRPAFLRLTMALVAILVVAACETPPPSTTGAASGAPATPGAGGETPGPALEADSATKIELAEESGAIDHPTALLYKVYAALDYANLPEAYRSTNPATHEATTVLAELGGGLADLTPEIRAKVEPFFLRPTDPKSFWQQRVATAGDGSTVALAAFHAVIEYGFEDAEESNVRIWYAMPLGTSERALAAQLADEIDSSDMWQKEKTAMLGHEPCTDAASPNNGGDGRLDIYLVYPSTGLDWSGRSDVLGYDDEGDAHNGVDIFDGPGDGCPITSHVLVNAALPFDRLKSTTAHELFHAFQYSFRNTHLPDRAWWMEASATWAKDLVYPEQNFEQAYLKGYWSEVAGAEGPVDSEDGVAEYATYLLPFYLVQKSGDKTGTVVGRLWQASETSASIRAVGALPAWSDSFKEFALWNWNKSDALNYYDAGAEIPEAKLKQLTTCLDSHVPTGGECILKVGNTAAFIDLGSTSVRYLEGVPDQPLIELLKFDLTDVMDKPGLGIQALLTIGDTTEIKVEDWTGLSEREFCIPSEDLRKVVLVVSNSNIAPDATVQGQVKIEALESGCSGWRGTITSTWDYGSVNARHGSLSATVLFQPDPVFPEHFFVTDGTATWSETGNSGTNCQLRGSGTYSLVVPGDDTKPPGTRAGQLRIWDGGDTDALRYSGIGHQTAADPQFSTMTCEGQPPFDETTDAGNWLAIGSSLPPPALGYTGEDSLTFPSDATTFSGSYTHTIEGEPRQTWQWTFEKVGD